MKRMLIAALLLAPTPVTAAPAPLSKPLQARIRCVAALAIVQSDKERGVEKWDEYPDFSDRGLRFANMVRAELVKTAGRTDAAAKQEIVGAIGTLQKQARASNGDTLITALAAPCVAMLDKAIPPRPQPSLTQCAAAVGLAHQEVSTEEGSQSKTARDLAIYATLLDGKARAALRAQGKTETETDRIMGLEKERLMAEYKAAKGKGRTDGLDYRACFAMARPTP